MTPRLPVLLVALAAFGAWFAASSHATTGESPSGAWDPVAVARAHLAQAGGHPGFRGIAVDYEATSLRTSPSAVHVQLVQTVNGVPVLGSVSTVSMRQGDNVPRFAIDRQRPIHAAPPVPQPAISSKEAEVLAERQVSATLVRRGDAKSRAVYYPLGQELRLAWEVEVPALSPLGDWLVVIDASNGALLGLTDLLAFDSGHVFTSNPFLQSGGTVPPPNDCDSSANATALSGLRQSVTLLGIDAAQNKLKGEYADLTATGIAGAYKPAGVANEPTRVYSYACNDDRFEEVMAYYHIDRTQRFIQSLGFLGASSIRGDSIPAHAHFYNQCNAFYSPFDAGLHFGDGTAIVCPPDAGEDASIIIHEYGHALQDDSTPGWGRSAIPLLVEQTRGIGEGFSDYLSATMLGTPCIGGWGLFPGACLRTLENTNTYPVDFEACPDKPDGSEQEHCAGLIWSGSLWDLAVALGDDDDARKLVLRLALAAGFYLAPTATFAENAAAILQADLELYGGAHAATIEAAFTARGITPATTIADPAYYFLRIRHTFVGDLEVTLKVGPNIASPVCTEVIWSHGGGGSDDLLGVIDISGSGCSPHFPPSEANPWHLEVKDTGPGDVGLIADFQVTMPESSERCVTPGAPLPIPDNSAVGVVATVDCTEKELGQIFDMDGDRCSNIAELGAEPTLGGDRDPLDPWDFFEVSGDAMIDFNDSLLVLGSFGLGPGDPLYDPLLDRQAPDSEKPYLTAAAGDGIDFNDVLLNLGSFGHGCAVP